MEEKIVLDITYVKLNPGQPCYHNGCLSHITHPCEVCGRIAGNGDSWVEKEKLKKFGNIKFI